MNTKMLNASAETMIPARPASTISQAAKKYGCRSSAIAALILSRPPTSATLDAPVTTSSNSALSASIRSSMPYGAGQEPIS